MEAPQTRGSRPGVVVFSLVVAVHDVERYLGDFIASVEAQRYDLRRVEVIAVDDGSTDGSLARLRAWQARRPDLVRVLTQANAGQAAARNAGLPHARGRWVGFPDPDDALEPTYLSTVAAALEGVDEAGVDMIVLPLLRWDEASGKRTDTHQRRDRFRRTRVVDLAAEPAYFPGSVSAAFFPLGSLRAEGLVFNERLRPHFEDTDFGCRHLLARPHPRLLYVTGTWYHYRRRADRSSTLQTKLTDPCRYTDVPREGFLALLRDAAAVWGTVPVWVQDTILYELHAYLQDDQRPVQTPSALHGEVAAEFVRLLGQIAGYLDPAVIRAFRVSRYTPERADLLAYGVRGVPYVARYVWCDHIDPANGQARLRLRYSGSPEPAVDLVGPDGRPARVIAHKRRAVVYFEHALLHELVWWVASPDRLRARVNGQDWPILAREPTAAPPRDSAHGHGLTRLVQRARLEVRRRVGPRGLARLAGAAALDLVTPVLVRLPAVRRRYAEAWTFAGGASSAGADLEALFRYVRRCRTDINAWFVCARGSATWTRLARDHRDRLVSPRGLPGAALRQLEATLLCAELSPDVVRPPVVRRHRPRPSRLVYLPGQAVDQGAWRLVNAFPVDVCLLATAAEAVALAADDSPFLLTAKEAGPWARPDEAALPPPDDWCEAAIAAIAG